MIIFFKAIFYTEHFFETSWNDTWIFRGPSDCKSLSGTSLAVSKDADIISIYCTLNEHLSVLEYGILIGRGIEARVKLKFLVLVLSQLTRILA